MKDSIENSIKEILKNLGVKEDISFVVECPDDTKNGDYSTNVAMMYFSNYKKNIKDNYNLSKNSQTDLSIYRDGKEVRNPKEFAELVKDRLEKRKLSGISRIEVAGPGFINFYLSKEFFVENIEKIIKCGNKWGSNNLLSGKKIMVEYTDPNPFKPFHIGHLMTNAIGESISRIVEFSGAKVVRANYQGDVGPHVAKAIYAILNSKKYLEVGLSNITGSVSDKAIWIGECYSKGSNLYDADENIKKEIDEINKKIYEKSDSKINEIYEWGRKVTLEAFEEIYKLLDTKFDRYFFESKMAPIGEKIVKKNIGKIFEESNGAIVFHGEKYDPKLHTRVFINSQNIPTYEAKEVGLTVTKFKKKNIFEKKLDLSIVTTAVEQADYMRVVQKAISLIYPDLENRMKHITHGMMKLLTGKMSSRKGNIVTGVSLLEDSIGIILEKMKDREISEEERKKISEVVGISALKYSILKSSLGSDIIYDFEKSISFEGDSGPYLQYTAVRAKAILNKSKDFDMNGKGEVPKEITELEKTLYQFPEIVVKSYSKLEPHHIATYLTLLASTFNSFYSNTQILKEENNYMSYHLEIVKGFYQTMENGLWLLGIKIPEKM